MLVTGDISLITTCLLYTSRAKRELLMKEQDRFLRQVYDEVNFILSDIDRLNLSITGEYRRCKDCLLYTSHTNTSRKYG